MSSRLRLEALWVVLWVFIQPVQLGAQFRSATLQVTWLLAVYGQPFNIEGTFLSSEIIACRGTALQSALVYSARQPLYRDRGSEFRTCHFGNSGHVGKKRQSLPDVPVGAPDGIACRTLKDHLQLLRLLLLLAAPPGSS